MKDQSSVPVAQKMTDVSLLIFPVEVQKRRIQMIDNNIKIAPGAKRISRATRTSCFLPSVMTAKDGR
jgi:hypothetical protein